MAAKRHKGAQDEKTRSESRDLVSCNAELFGGSVDFRHVFVGVLVEVGEAVFAAQFDSLAVVREDVGFVAEVVTGNDAFGERIGPAGSDDER